MITINENEYCIEDSNILFLNGQVSTEMAEYVIRMVIEKNLKEKEKPDHLKMIVNSPGGYVTDCFAMIDIMNAFPIPIHTYAVGQVASCGLMLFMAGARGHRYMFKNSSILSHQWSGFTEGKEHEIKASGKENKLVSKRIYNLYENATDLSKEDIHKYLLPPEDVWLSPQEAVRYGIADKIVSKI